MRIKLDYIYIWDIFEIVVDFLKVKVEGYLFFFGLRFNIFVVFILILF